MKIVICPDSFKESLPADAAAQAIAEGVRELWPDAECVCLPLADGGEGTLDALVSATGGQLLRHTVRGPLGAPVDARFAVLGDGETALIEMAEAAGLMRIPRSERDPLRASTYGVGELIAAALAQGARPAPAACRRPAAAARRRGAGATGHAGFGAHAGGAGRRAGGCRLRCG